MRKIVKLKAGTYFVNPQQLPNAGGQVGIYVRVDNVTIRGEGADTTRLVANGTIPEYGAVILFGHRSGTGDASFGVQALTAGAARGATTIQVANGAGFSVGDVVTIDMLDGAAVQTGNVYLNGGYLWFYDGQYFKRQPTYGWSGPSHRGAGDQRLGPRLGQLGGAERRPLVALTDADRRDRRHQREHAHLEGSAPPRLPALLQPPGLEDHPGEHRRGPLGNRWSGIENIAVAGGNNQWGFPGGTINFSYMAYCWAKNVEADGERWSSDPVNHPGKYGYNIGIGRSYRCVVRDSYAHGSADENPGGQAYGIVVGAGSSACLVENNISVENNKPIALNSTGGGNVIAYNYVDQAVLWNSPGWQENAIDDCHANFTHHDLIEGNWTPNLGGDTTHGNSGWHTHLRNYVNGKNSSGSFTANLRAVGMDGWTHDHAYVGNVLKGGTRVPDHALRPRAARPSTSWGTTPRASAGTGTTATRWPTSSATGTGTTSATAWSGRAGAKTIPSSFYLTAKPAFFGNNAWPWVNPLTGQATTLPAKARYDAQTPNTVP